MQLSSIDFLPVRAAVEILLFRVIIIYYNSFNIALFAFLSLSSRLSRWLLAVSASSKRSKISRCCKIQIGKNYNIYKVNKIINGIIDTGYSIQLYSIVHKWKLGTVDVDWLMCLQDAGMPRPVLRLNIGWILFSTLIAANLTSHLSYEYNDKISNDIRVPISTTILCIPF